MQLAEPLLVKKDADIAKTLTAMKHTAAIFIACSTLSLFAAEPTLPTVPTVLEPLKAKVEGRHWAFKGTVLSFRAEQTLTEEQWKAIAGLGIKQFITGGKGIDDAAMQRLVKLNPEALMLDGAELTDAGFAHLVAMKSLRSLSVGHVMNKEFTGTGLALLKDLPALERVGIGGTSTGDAAMEAIGQLTQLKEFQTWHTHARDPRNLYLLKLTSLKVLELGNGMATYDGKPRQLSVTDVTMDTLAQMKSLERVFLMDARLTLPALQKLKALPNLKTLDLRFVDIPAEDLDKLRAEMPGVKIPQRPPMTDAERKRLEGFLKVE